jgi:hypothetical protein
LTRNCNRLLLLLLTTTTTMTMPYVAPIDLQVSAAVATWRVYVVSRANTRHAQLSATVRLCHATTTPFEEVQGST